MAKETGRGGRKGLGEGVKMAFWNVAGLGNKDREFWVNLRRWDAMVLLETWVEKKGGKKLIERLPEGYVWRVQDAKRRSKKGRAMGGMVLGIRKELYGGECGGKEEEGMMTGLVKVGRDRVRMVGVYVNMDLEGKLKRLADWMEGKEDGIKTVIGGDFNARTGREGGRVREEVEGMDGEGRKSKDGKVNRMGRRLVESIKGRGWYILNGDMRGDEEGNWTYTGGRGESVIDYILVEEETGDGIESLEVGGEIDSDHHPLIITWKEENEKWERKVELAKNERQVWEIVNGERKRVRGINKGIGMQEWEEYFRELLGGVEIERAMAIMGQVWGIGKRRFGRDWKRRMWLFDKLVWSVLGYGAEIWGWKERERVESLQERYIKWVLGVDRGTPGYMVREEIQREKMRMRAGKRAWAFKERLRVGRGGELARLEMERGEEEGEGIWKELRDKDVELQKGERWESIRGTRYNKWYGWIKGEGVPEYLKKGWGEGRWRRMARFRLGNEVREGRYWKGEEERCCRLCGNEEETWEHVWDGCRTWRTGTGGGWQEEVVRILGEEGEGEEWMREVEEERRRGGRVGRGDGQGKKNTGAGGV
ncbi:hypothetical protein ALC57_15112 [Trachymyrmex cornetzi]|uniref:Endonuclease/exonuclease/phosphatase domain-containing protein n=1 Tax=Trachymyrmex cornetzi TaxID=471704 RepID=A0A151K3F7_9HYME|nr:hypothetical protein ALC57_15112 [Trachymyrmex cornetzi]